MKKKIILLLLVISLGTLTGCVYKGDNTSEDKYLQENSTDETVSAINLENESELYFKNETNLNGFNSKNIYTINDNKTGLQYIMVPTGDVYPMTVRIDKDGKPYTENTHCNFKIYEANERVSIFDYGINIIEDLDTGVQYVLMPSGTIEPRLDINGLPYIKGK